MKKILFVTAAALICAGLNAEEGKFKSVNNVLDGDGHCDLIEGSMAVLGEDAGATLVFDFSNTHMAKFDRRNIKCEDMGTLPDYLAAKGEDVSAQWPDIEASVLQFTKDKINKTHSYKLHIDEENPKYEIKLVFEYLNPGNAVLTAAASDWGAGGAAFSGNMIITETATGNVALNLRIDYVYGVSSLGYHLTTNKRLQCTIADIYFGKYLPAVYRRNKNVSI